MPILLGRSVWTAILLIAAGFAGAACGTSVSGLPDGSCFNELCVAIIAVNLRNTTASPAYLEAGDGSQAYSTANARVLSGGSMTKDYSVFGPVLWFQAEVDGQVVATVGCRVTRAGSAPPVREVVFSGPPYQLTCQSW